MSQPGLVLAGTLAMAAVAVAAPLSLDSHPAVSRPSTETHPILSPATIATAPVKLGGSTPLPVSRAMPSALQLPWRFEAADERAPQGADFSARGHGYSVFVGGAGALVALRAESAGSLDAGGMDSAGARRRDGDFARRRGAAYRMVGVRFENARADARPRKEEPLAGRWYRLRGDAAVSKGDASQPCGRVVYGGVYPGIDVAYYGHGRELEYDFIVAPGASPAAARLRFDGVSGLNVNAAGDLELALDGSVLTQRAPVAYQVGPEGRESVPASYRVTDDGAVEFELGVYDATRALVIDPVLSYASFLGGSALDQCWDVAVDTDGSVVVAGETESETFASLKLGSTNAFQAIYQGGQSGVAGDAFVARLAPDGGQFHWFTYLGGSDYDAALTLALGAGGEPVVGGFTASTNFPVTAGALRTRPTGATNRFTGRFPLDAFVTRLTADGSALVASTLLGGDGEDQAIDLALLSNGQIALGGSTTSSNFPVTLGATQIGGGVDGFLAVLSPDGGTLLQSRYLGGSGRDSVEGISVSAGNLVHVAGLTSSTNFPVVAALQATNAGAIDAFVAGWQPENAGSLTYVTYLGGESDDYGYRAGAGPGGEVWVVGETFSTSFPIVNALQGTNGGASDGFLARLSADGASLQSSSYFGGIGVDALWDVRADALGYVHLAGESASVSLPGMSTNSLSSTNSGGTDLVIARLAADGTIYTTFYGGSGEEIGYGVAADGAGNSYVVGRVRTVNFPVSSTNVAQAVYGGGTTDGLVMKVTYEPALTVALSAGGDAVDVSWPAPNPEFVLELAEAPGAPAGAGWHAAAEPVSLQSGRHVVRLPLATSSSLFRLRAR